MDDTFVCSDCRSEHTEPASADLGHIIICLHCALVRDFESQLDDCGLEIVALVSSLAA